MAKQNNDGSIPAKVLFTGEYKNKNIRFYRSDIEQVKQYLPVDFEEKDAIYRGMNLSSYTDLQNIFKEGLLNSKTKFQEGIYLSKDVKEGISYSAQYDYGHLPVLIKRNFISHTKDRYVVFFDVKAEDIADVLVWTELEGKKGWWRASLDSNGEVVLQPTENMGTVSAPAPEQKDIKSEQGISAKVLFTKEYINKDIPVPAEDEENYGDYRVSSNVDIARGMALGTYESLKEVFKGLSAKKVRNYRAKGQIYFSNVINVAVYYAKQDEYGHIPVVIISNKEVANRDKGENFWAFENFAAEDIKEVLVWAEIEGKIGWWKAELDENGEVILKYTGLQTLKGYGTFTVKGGGII